MFLKISQISQGKTCDGVSFQVFSWEICEISKNTFFYRTPLVASFLMFSRGLAVAFITFDRHCMVVLNFFFEYSSSYRKAEESGVNCLKIQESLED